MKLRTLALLILAPTAAFLIWGPSASSWVVVAPFGSSSAGNPELVRQMANFLEAKPGEHQPVVRFGPRPRTHRGPARGTDRLAGVLKTAAVAEVQFVDDSAQRLADAERSIDGHYSANPGGRLIRRYVSIMMTGTDSEYNTDSSRRHMLNELMKNPAPAAREVQSSLNTIPADAEEERGALLHLAEELSRNEQASHVVEGIFRNEIQRPVLPSAGSSELAEIRTAQLIDSYSLIVHDLNKQIRFVRMGLASQEEPRVREMLQGRLENLTRIDPSQYAASLGQSVGQSGPAGQRGPADEEHHTEAPGDVDSP